MVNKSVLIGLIIALLQAASAEETNCEPSQENGVLPHFISLGKSIDGKQSVLEDALERLSAKVNAAEERWTEKVTKLERKLEDLINPQTNSSAVATHPKRPAELACEETHDVRSAAIHNNTIPYIIHLVAADGDRRICNCVLISKRFVVTTQLFAIDRDNRILEFSFSDRVVSKGIQHLRSVLRMVPNGIILIGLDSDVDFNYWLYPTCLYTSEFYPKSALMHDGKTIQIAKHSYCLGWYSKELSPYRICVEGDCGFSDPVFLIEEGIKPQLFGFIDIECNNDYRKVYKVFPYLDFIENIVWPKSEN